MDLPGGLRIISKQPVPCVRTHCMACLTGRLRCDVLGPGGGVGGATELDQRGAQRHRGAAGLDQQLRRYEELHASAGPRRCSLRPYGCVWRESVIHTADPLRILIQSVWGRTVDRPGGVTDDLSKRTRSSVRAPDGSPDSLSQVQVCAGARGSMCPHTAV